MGKAEVVPEIKRLQRDLDTMAGFRDETQQGWTRKAFSSSYEKGRQWLKGEMEALGMETAYDAASNLIGRIKGSNPSVPCIMIGSHTDTVAGGGRFDGIIGVLAGLEIVRMLKSEGIRLQHTLEVVDFTAEEPTEFGISTVGSRGMVNGLSPEMLGRKDSTGHSLGERIKETGGNLEKIPYDSRKKGDVAVYLELHIEQGPILEAAGRRLGLVTGIAGIHRYRVAVEGNPNHAGTTPMDARCDALTAAAEMVLCLEAICRETYTETVVGTVGRLNVEPNAANVIPGRVTFELEVRSLDTEILEKVVSRYGEALKKVSENRHVPVTLECISKSNAIRIRPEILQVMENACKPMGEMKRLFSGAGHDANHLAGIAPIGMIFVPSRHGRSHCPEEWTSIEDVSMGVKALFNSLLAFDEILD